MSVKNFSEEELITYLKTRSRQGFEILYEHYSNAMLGVINTIVKNTDDAENLLQDSFVKIWNNIEQYDSSRGRLFTWIITICRNTALNFLRSNENIRKTSIQNDELGVHTERLIAEPAPTDHIGISKLVEKLDEKHQVVINLIYFWGYTQQEVAKQLGLPLGTVKTRTRTALQMLKAQVK
ncbi:MAG: sigma-70 family RNA polymerase sigma factor [Bacteroidetes bacterium]|nr:sigma-70 family RNA polymerase sigma factor [Bacteroidota bacterium]